jgi:hypothetical protein
VLEPVLEAAEREPEAVLEAAEVEVQTHPLMRLTLRPEQMRLKQPQPREPAVAGAVADGAQLRLQPPTRHLGLLSRHWRQRFKRLVPLDISGRPRVPGIPCDMPTGCHSPMVVNALFSQRIVV